MSTVLTIPTYDGSGEAVHPDVIKVGATYWMALTPYPGSDDAFEDPSILRSSDGITWTVPAGLTNPVIAEPAGGFLSDPDLAWDGSSFWLFWREVMTATNRERIYTASSADGVTWGAPTSVLEGFDSTRLLSAAVSLDDGTWRMWVIDAAASPNVMRMRTASSPTGPWSAAQDRSLPVPSGREIWHVDVVPYVGGFVAALVYRDAGEGGNISLAFGASHTGLDWKVDAPSIEPGGIVAVVYRGSLLREAGAWRLWYSDQTTGSVWRILHEPSVSVPDAREIPSALTGGISPAWPSFRP